MHLAVLLQSTKQSLMHRHFSQLVTASVSLYQSVGFYAFLTINLQIQQEIYAKNENNYSTGIPQVIFSYDIITL